MARRPLRTALAVVTVVVVALIAPPPPAQAAVDLPASTIYEVSGVPGGSRVFVATGENTVLVADRTGVLTAQVAVGSRAVSVGLGADGTDGTVWVALPDARQIVAVDGQSLAIRARYGLPPDTCPGDVAATGRFVVFGFDCIHWSQDANPPGAVGIGVLDTSTGAVSTVEPYLPGLWPIVATSPGLPGRMFAVDYQLHSTALALLDVTSGTPTWVTSYYLQNETVTDLAVSPDGATVAISTLGHGVLSFSTADVSRSTTYPVDNATSLGWSADSRTLAVGSIELGAAFHVSLFGRGSTTPLARGVLPADPERRPADRGLVLGAGARDALIGTRAWWEARAFLDQVGLRPSAVTVTGPATAGVTLPVTVHASVTLDGTPAPAGTPLRAYRDIGVGELTDLGTVLTDATGTATLIDSTIVTGPVGYLLRYAGDTSYALAEGRTTVQMQRLTTDLSVAFRADRAKGKTLPGTVLVTLGPTASVGHRYVTVTATTSAGTQYIIGDSVPTDAPLTVPYTVSVPTTFTATYQGNQWQEPATASTTVLPPTRGHPVGS